MNTLLCICAGDTAGGGAAVAQGAHLCNLTRYLNLSPLVLSSSRPPVLWPIPFTLSPCQHLILPGFYIFANLMEAKWNFIWVLLWFPTLVLWGSLLSSLSCLVFFSAHLSMGLFFNSSCFLYILDANPFFVCCSCMLLCTQFLSTKLCLRYTSVFYKSNTGYSEVKQTWETVLLKSPENHSRKRWTETGPGYPTALPKLALSHVSMRPHTCKRLKKISLCVHVTCL